MDGTGLVVARHRRHIDVEDVDRSRHLCLARRRDLNPLVGDRVLWHREADGTCVVTEVLDRDSTLTRIDSRGRCEPVAANVTQLLAVAAAAPEPDWFLLDRYLAAAELMYMRGVVVFNKMDLVEQAPDLLHVYESIGYPVHRISVRARAGLGTLGAAMRGHRSAMVGQSGVGKSSLLNALLGERAQGTGALAGKGGHGRHTTTAATLYRLPAGGELIDSPGVRNYAPYIEEPADVQHGFRELREQLGRCRFDDCLHRAEPDCAVKAAVAAGRVDSRRYDSYTKLCALVESLQRKR
jgi:ribosome biogenesis GTPase